VFLPRQPIDGLSGVGRAPATRPGGPLPPSRSVLRGPALLGFGFRGRAAAVGRTMTCISASCLTRPACGNVR